MIGCFLTSVPLGSLPNLAFAAVYAFNSDGRDNPPVFAATLRAALIHAFLFRRLNPHLQADDIRRPNTPDPHKTKYSKSSCFQSSPESITNPRQLTY